MDILKNKATRQRFVTTYAAFIINGMMALSVGSMLPFIRDDRGLNYAFAGLIVSLHSVGNLCSSFLSGTLAAYIGRKRSVLIFDFFMPVAYLLILLTDSNIFLALAFLMTGLARGANSNYCNSVVNSMAPGKAWILNGLHAMFSVGAFLFPLILSLFTAADPSGYTKACIFLLIMGIISFTLYMICPEETGNKDSKEKEAVSGTNRKRDKKSLAFFREKIFLLTTLTLFFYLCAEQGVIGWMVTYFTDTGYISASLAQITASILWIMMLLGRLLTAYLSEKTDKRKLLPIMGAGIVVFFVALLFVRSSALIVICIMGFGFFMAGIYPTTVSFGGKLIKEYSLAWSFILTMASFGSILMPSIVGNIAEVYGIQHGISTIAIAVVLDFVLIMMLSRIKEKYI